MKNIFAIVGSASADSANLKLIKRIAGSTSKIFAIHIFEGLKTIPHFDADLSTGNTPQSVLDFRELITKADAVLICTPEYVFSIPSGLKNAIEWCVASTVFSNKPIGLITASASGEKGHEELQMIMRTMEAKFNSETALLIKGIKGKFDREGNLIDKDTINAIDQFTASLNLLIENQNRE